MKRKMDPLLLKTLYETMHIGVVFVNNEGIIIDANAAAESILNLSKEGILQRHAFNDEYELVDDQENTMAMVESPIYLTLKTHKQIGPKNMGIRKRNEKNFKWLSVTSMPILDKNNNVMCVYSTFEDVTEKRNAEKKYELLFNEMLDGYALHEMIYDETGTPKDYRYLVVNQAFRAMTGFGDENIVGKTVLDLLPNTERYWIDTYGSVAQTGKPVWFEQYSGELGKTFEVKAFSPERDKFAVIITDVSERKALENQMKISINASEEALKSQGRFLANISHEIRTPMNSILGVLALLEFTKLDDEQSEYISIARKAASILLELVDDVLTLSKIESGKMTFEEKNFSLFEIVACTWPLFSNKARLKGIVFIENIDLPKDVLFLGDASKMTQILMNLLSNAVKFTSNGNIELTIKQKQTDNPEINEVSIIVKDTGIGMSAAFVDKLFVPYHQEHRENEQQGYGLGLVITKELVTLMGGTISVKSELGVGSVFTVKIPLKMTFNAQTNEVV